MKVIPGVYVTGGMARGKSYQLILSGRRQYNVAWMFGEDHVTVTFHDGMEAEKGWQDCKRVSIPGDYKGKYWGDVAKGMSEHLMTICRGIVREWEGESSLSEFREEWAMHKWTKGQKVAYSTIAGGNVLGVVQGTERHIGERDVIIRVTSRKNPLYPCGYILRLSPTCPWLKSREA